MNARQRVLARFLLENQDRVAFGTAQNIGDAVGLSAAAVVRFAQSLGYKGYAELRQSLRDGRPSFPSFRDQLRTLADGSHSSPADLIRLAFRYEQENLAATARSLDPMALAGAASAISDAAGVIVVGSGVGRAVVNLLAGHLSRIRNAVGVPADSVDAVIGLANAGPGHVLIAVSFWRFARSTRDVLALAKQRGVTTVAIVDSPLYPAAEYVDHMLVVSSRNPGHGPSTVAADAVANALISATILTDFPRYLAAIEHVDEAYAESGVYLE